MFVPHLGLSLLHAMAGFSINKSPYWYCIIIIICVYKESPTRVDHLLILHIKHYCPTMHKISFAEDVLALNYNLLECPFYAEQSCITPGIYM